MKTKKQEEEYQDLNEIIDESKQDLLDYIDRKLALAKLRLYEKIANFSSRVLYGLILLVIGLIMLLVSFITLGLYLGQLLGNYAAGFSIMILAGLLSLILFIINRKSVRKYFVNLTIRTLRRIESDEE